MYSRKEVIILRANSQEMLIAKYDGRSYLLISYFRRFLIKKLDNGVCIFLRLEFSQGYTPPAAQTLERDCINFSMKELLLIKFKK